jgi:regulator of sigma E protease
MSIIIFIIVLAILILVHEFGHFIIAKKSGIKVPEFGLGFPPKIFAKKWGETTYTLNAIPFGGFVKIFGEDPHAEEISPEEKHRSFFYKPKWIQALVLVGGVAFNIIFAWLLISLGFVIGLPTPVDYATSGQVQNARLTVTEIVPGSPAEKAGLKTGDTIFSVAAINPFESKLSGTDDLTADKVRNLISQSHSKNIEIMYMRGRGDPGLVKTAVIEPTETSGTRMIGIGMDVIGTLKLPVHKALVEGVKTTWYLTKGTAVGLTSFLWDAVRFKSDLSQVSGPVGIAGTVGQASHLGFVYLLSLVALISINLAVINLLPFPALDGGRLLFVGIEAIIRRPIPTSFARWVNAVGFLFLLGLMGVITVHDIFKLF